MASRSRHSSRSDRDSDSMEAIKPLVVLVLFGTILYGAYSVVQKGPSTTDQAAPEAPPFAPPPVEIASAAPAQPPSPAPAVTLSPGPVSGAPAAAAAVSVPPPAGPTAGAIPATAAAVPPLTPAATGPATAGIIAAPAVPTAAPPTMPSVPPTSPLQPAAIGAVTGAAAALGAAATEAALPPTSGPTYLTAESAPPPAHDALATLVPQQPVGAGDRPDRYATLATTPPATASLLPGGTPPPPSSAAAGSSAAFATAWADAHEKLATGRYAEALAALSIWYDDPSLGLEESQRLEDLLGQLAGSVIYSQQDLLLPPHVVAAGETLPMIAMSLGVSWQLLGKINGITDPHQLMPGEHLKLLRGPFDAVVSISRRRLSLQLGGNYAGSFPVVVGRQYLSRVGTAIAVVEVRRGGGRDVQAMAGMPADPAAKPAIVLADGMVIEAAEDPGVVSDTSPTTSLVVSVRDLAELLDILGPGSKVLIRQ